MTNDYTTIIHCMLWTAHYKQNCNKLDLCHLICTAKFIVLAMFVSTLYSHVYLIGAPIFKVFFMFAYCIITHKEIKALCDKCDDYTRYQPCNIQLNTSRVRYCHLVSAWLQKTGRKFIQSLSLPFNLCVCNSIYNLAEMGNCKRWNAE